MKKRASTKATPAEAEVPPAREEWDFSNCPKDEIVFCRFYEFSRHNDGLKDEIAERRKMNSWSSGLSPEHWEHYERQRVLIFFQLFDEFPSTPWLRIDAKKRIDCCRQCRLLEGPFYVVSPSRIDLDAHYPYEPLDTGLVAMHRVYAVEIDFSASKDAIRNSFERWLDVTHPNGESVQEQRGGTEDADLLKVLGAWRLFTHFNRDWVKASEWSTEHSLKGKPLYSDQAGWIKAERRVKEIIEGRVSASPTARLISRLPLSNLPMNERVAIKVFVGTEIDRAMARRLNKMSPDCALAEVRAMIIGA